MEDGEEAARRGEGRDDAPEPPGREGTGPSDPPGGAGGSGESGAGRGAGEDEGLSTAAKVGLGCGGCLVVVLAAVGIGLALGGGWITQRAGDLVGGFEEQAEATETLSRLREEHPFEVPDDGAVSPERARRFFRATDAAWRDMRDWAAELEELERELEGRDPNLSDYGAVLEGYGKMAESRVVLARALEEQEMPLGEYLWTGSVLHRAYRALEDGAGSGAGAVPEETRRAVAEHREELAELTGDDAGAGKRLVLAFAAMWGSTEGTVRRAMEADTLLLEP